MVAQEVAHRTTNQEVPSSIPTGNWAFFFSSLSYLSLNQWCILKQVPRGGASQLIINFTTKMKAQLSSLRQSNLINMHGMRNKFGTIVALGLFNKAFGAYSFPKILVDEEKYIKLDSWSKD